jgi:allophanate hydrolase subunit 2
LPYARPCSLPSLGVVPGCIQVPPDGAPILLLADAQTTGGYPLAGTVIAADLPLAAQLLPGDTLRLAPVTLNEALAARREVEAALNTPLDADDGELLAWFSGAPG